MKTDDHKSYIWTNVNICDHNLISEKPLKIHKATLPLKMRRIPYVLSQEGLPICHRASQ